MRTTFDLDEELLREAQRLTGMTERTAVIHEALRALIERESARRLARLGATERSFRVPRRRRGKPSPVSDRSRCPFQKDTCLQGSEGRPPRARLGRHVLARAPTHRALRRSDDDVIRHLHKGEARRYAWPVECPFCQRPAALVAENAFAIAFPDAFPLTPGHTLVVPRRHAGDIAELGAEERAALWELVEPVRRALRLAHQPDGFNLGMNLGAAAGQTVAHVHLHVIPRYRGDMEDPRGGIRLLFPERARYWERG